MPVSSPHGSVREVMGWDEMCNVELPVPSIEEQRSIVKATRQSPTELL
ncbi:MAG: restriction endonuclease subunit S [Eubacteriales bacterium]